MDTLFAVIGAIVRGIWYLISFLAFVVYDSVTYFYDTHQLRNLQKQRNQETAAKEAAAVALAATYKDDAALIDEITKTTRTTYSLCTVPGKCAGCATDLGRTDLDPSSPHFCSDDCKERCIKSLKTSDFYFDSLQEHSRIRDDDRIANRDEDWRHNAALRDLNSELERRLAALRERLGYEPVLYLSGTHEAKDTPRAARKDQNELTAMYKAEKALHQKNLSDIQAAYEAAGIALTKDTAQKIRERIDFNRKNLNDLFADEKRILEEHKKRREEQAIRDAADRQWYTPLGEPPGA